MKKNIGAIDRIIRSLFSIVILILILTNTISGILSVLLFSLSVIFLVTSLLSYCPTYILFKYNTCKLTKGTD